MQNRYVLVLGSKPKCKIPVCDFDKIYAANGAAERSKKFKKKKLTCVVGMRNFLKNTEVKKRILNSKPEKIIVRSSKVYIAKKLKKKLKLLFLSNSEQLNFQKKFFKYGKFSLIFSEFFYKTGIFKKIFYLINLIKRKSFQGVSTGFFAILVALEENPKSNIVVSGIGMSGGGQFYRNPKNISGNYDSRAAVDRFLIKLLKDKFKKKIFSQDKDFNKIVGIQYFHKIK